MRILYVLLLCLSHCPDPSKTRAIKDQTTKDTTRPSPEQKAHRVEAAIRNQKAAAKERLAEAEKQKRREHQAARVREAKEAAALRQEAQAKEEAARKARLAEREALRFEEEASVTSQHIVLGSTLVTFAAGLEVKSIVSGFESCRITIKNLPTDAKRHEITDLFTQQGMSQHDVHTLSLQSHNGRLEAKVLTRDEGRIVALGLDGIDFRDKKLEFEVSETVSANAMGESNNRRADILTIHWFAPSLNMIVTYPSMDAARQKQQELDGKIVGSHKIKVEMNRPPTGSPALRYYNPASVKIMGLPINTSIFDVSSMAGSATVRPIKSNTYDLQQLLRDLQLHLASLTRVKMTSFEKATDTNLDGSVTVKVRFDSWEDANTARASLDGKRLRPEYPTFRLHLPQPHHFRRTIPIQQYRAQQQLWDTIVKDNSEKGPRVFIDRPPSGEVAIICLSGSDKKLVGALKVRVETLVAGEKLGAYWHRSFIRPQGRQFLTKIFSSTKVYVRCDFKTRSLRIYGEGEAKERARQLIKEEVERLAQEEWPVFLKRQSVGYFVRKGLAALKEILGEDAVSLDLASTPCKLTIRGGEEARHALDNLINQSLNDLDLGFCDSSNNVCPICYDAVSDPLPLGCKHVYCTACIRHYIISAAETKIFPLVCMGDEAKCKVPISIPTIRRFLTPLQFENLIDVVFSTYLDQHPQEFRYCTTPDCTQIYRANTESILKCPSCFAEVCSSCHEEAHEGMTCKDRRARKVEQEDQLNDSWARMKGVKRCPECSIYIEKIDGCNHMSCRCGAHICWICVKTFPADQIYLHLGSVHGGAFDGDGERQNLDLRHAVALQHQLDEQDDFYAPRLPLLPIQARPAQIAEQWLQDLRAAERRDRERREAEAAQRMREYQRQFDERQERVARELEERRRNEGRGGCLIM
ncbi:hypothetical protein C0993_005704 [Termitomyces sp. T159_Od127]|nr:hypothetical protein C0993_005704 [Termitomyces sp. T159_Od127]